MRALEAAHHVGDTYIYIYTLSIYIQQLKGRAREADHGTGAPNKAARSRACR